MDIIKNASETIFKRLVWHTAKRDQAGIAEKLANEQEVHEIYGLGDAGLFDEFSLFCANSVLWKFLNSLLRDVIVSGRASSFFCGYAHLFNAHCSRIEVFLPYWSGFIAIAITYASRRI